MDTSEEKQTIKWAPKWRIAYGKGRRVQSEEVILLGWGECRSSKYLGNLGGLPGSFSDKDELQARTKRIRMQKYLREKVLPPHSMHCSNFSGRIYVEKTPE